MERDVHRSRTLGKVNWGLSAVAHELAAGSEAAPGCTEPLAGCAAAGAAQFAGAGSAILVRGGG